MKKCILPVLLALLLTGCASGTYTPVLNTDFSLNGVFQTGDFSYSCRMVKNGETVSITATSTDAKGLRIRCDGRQVTFQRGSMLKTCDRAAVDKTNPAVLLYEVFTALETEKHEVKKRQEGFVYTGNTGAGRFELTQNGDGDPVLLRIPAADITVTFQPED